MNYFEKLKKAKDLGFTSEKKASTKELDAFLSGNATVDTAEVKPSLDKPIMEKREESTITYRNVSGSRLMVFKVFVKANGTIKVNNREASILDQLKDKFIKAN